MALKPLVRSSKNENQERELKLKLFLGRDQPENCRAGQGGGSRGSRPDSRGGQGRRGRQARRECRKRREHCPRGEGEPGKTRIFNEPFLCRHGGMSV